jgi:hypothetical protein
VAVDRSFGETAVLLQPGLERTNTVIRRSCGHRCCRLRNAFLDQEVNETPSAVHILRGKMTMPTDAWTPASMLCKPGNDIIINLSRTEPGST